MWCRTCSLIWKYEDMWHCVWILPVLINCLPHDDLATWQKDILIKFLNRDNPKITHKWSFYATSQLHDFWRLDYWEDDLRRRRRFVRNPFGSTHADISLKTLEEYGQWCAPTKASSHGLFVVFLWLIWKHSCRHRGGRGGLKVKEKLPQPISGHSEPGGGANVGGRWRRHQLVAREGDW